MAKENNEMKINSFSSADINESYIREYMPEILDLLLIDRTTSTIRTKRNIIWANENYIRYGVKNYSAKSQIKPELVTGSMSNIIKPRSLKSKEIQKERTKSKGEVFTPTWIVKKQNDEIDKNYKNDSLETYVGRTWIEVTCGEAPYMVSRYDMESGRIIPLNQRVGFVDRKLKRINKEVNDKAEWQRLVVEAFKSSYGFEWSGDSLLLARENLLYSYRDFYYAKWLEEPLHGLFKDIAEIISYNVFQMDGLKYIIPLSEKKIKRREVQLSLFQDEAENNEIVKPGKRVKIMNWRTNKMEYFDKGVK
ncbi:restriction endonuclease [Staphylococcus cornubiensis]|uniref:restriction endonuclease n=1 Tax=Staphylococcus cornubiensis TaxID=1986155 RepID=UPI000A3C3F3D|nr:restriction endonuclease [Staphylococcus cornubiensis]